MYERKDGMSTRGRRNFDGGDPRPYLYMPHPHRDRSLTCLRPGVPFEHTFVTVGAWVLTAEDLHKERMAALFVFSWQEGILAQRRGCIVMPGT